MKKFYEIGDIHFSAINPWNFQAGEKFIEWFDKQDFGNKEDVEFGFAGDIAERDTNPGLVVNQIDRFFNIVSKKAKHVYVTVGNHDKKLYHDVEQHSLYFLENKGNITVVDKEKEIVTENGFDVLFLPHQRINNMSLIEYYNNNLPKEMLDKKYDIIFGHWAIKQEHGLEYMRNGVDISQFKANSYAIGHVHLRIRDEYLGSVWPNSEPEYDPKRPHGYKVLDENRNETFVEFPEFLAYKREEFGKDIKDSDNVIVYTITNCNSLTEARNKYPNIYIKDIERPLADLGYDLSDTDDVKTVAGGYVNDLSKAFDEMINEEKLEVTRRTYSLCKTLLKEKE